MRAEATYTATELEQTEASPKATVIVLSSAELSPCTCPDYCERDHDRD
jgi:hypothetical protein